MNAQKRTSNSTENLETFSLQCDMHLMKPFLPSVCFAINSITERKKSFFLYISITVWSMLRSYNNNTYDIYFVFHLLFSTHAKKKLCLCLVNDVVKIGNNSARLQQNGCNVRLHFLKNTLWGCVVFLFFDLTYVRI